MIYYAKSHPPLFKYEEEPPNSSSTSRVKMEIKLKIASKRKHIS